MLKAHAHAHAWPYVTLMPTCRAKPRVDLGSWSVDESGQFSKDYLGPVILFVIDLVIDVHLSMRRVDNLWSRHDVQNGKSPFRLLHPFNVMWHREILQSVSYAHRRTLVDKFCRWIELCRRTPCTYNDMMRANASDSSQFLPSVKTPVWVPVWKLLSSDTPNWFIIVPPWKRFLDFDHFLGGRVLVSLSTECRVPHYHSGNTWRTMVWHMIIQDVTLDVHWYVTWRYQMSPLQAKFIAAVSIVNRVMQSLFCSYN